IANRLRRHRLQPQTLDRLFRAGVLDDVAEDQLSFAASIAGIDNLGNVFVSDELSKHADPTTHFVRRFKLELWGHDREYFHVPFVLLFHGGRDGELEEMTDRPRDQVFLVLEIVLAFLEAAERLGDVAGDRRFLGNDEGLRHGEENRTQLVRLCKSDQSAGTRGAPVSLWLAELNEVFSGQLLDQTL